MADKSKKEAGGVGTTAAKNTTGSTTGNAVTKTKREPPVKRPRLRPISGIELLRRAADLRLAQIADLVAETLKEEAKKGKLNSTKMLVSLANNKEPQPQPAKNQELAKRPDVSDWLARLAADPVFRGSEEPGADVASGAEQAAEQAKD